MYDIVYQLRLHYHTTCIVTHAYILYNIYIMQIGNEKEVMYFCSSTEEERDAWIDTLRKGISTLTLVNVSRNGPEKQGN